MNFSQEFLLWKLENDYRNVMDFAKKKAEEIGRAEVRAEFYQEQIENAIFFIKETALSDEMIAQGTRLPLEKVKELRMLHTPQ
ncbi:MAG: hypothetical protein EAZ95_12705 [Bacteroidetes bacterium]|nr:MAG: hypothetical protein EAZ95_12705 [Bacteroidota bacterium]